AVAIKGAGCIARFAQHPGARRLSDLREMKAAPTRGADFVSRVAHQAVLREAGVADVGRGGFLTAGAKENLLALNIRLDVLRPAIGSTPVGVRPTIPDRKTFVVVLQVLMDSQPDLLNVALAG